MKIAEIMRPDDVLLGVSVPNKKSLLCLVAETAGATTGIDHSYILNTLKSREALGSTGIGAGIAIPHAAVKGLTSPFALFVRLTKAIHYEAIDEEPVDLACLVLTPLGEHTHYLQLLAKLARRLRSAGALKTIRHASDRDLVYRAITDCDCH